MAKSAILDPTNIIRRVPNISYEDFRKEHLLPNQPLIIGPELIQNLPCLDYWRLLSSPTQSQDSQTSTISPGMHSKPNLSYMRDKYGHFIVPVDEDGCRTERPLEEVIHLWQTGEAKEIYVKDWHLALQLSRQEGPSDKGEFYITPDIFKDDWMNRYYMKETQDDFRFVYMGPSGTCTRLHRDVYTSYSWSTNVVGRKRWWLFPPHVTKYITKPSGETIWDDVSVASFGAEEFMPKSSIWPNWEIAKGAMHVVEQDEGETIFVPSGWYHQVLNLTFCISINHNWSNSHNLQSMYHSMVDAVARVEDSIDDVKELLKKQHPQGKWEDEWVAVVQDLLKQDSGWDWLTFLKMVLLNLEDCTNSKPERVQNSTLPNIDCKAARQDMTYISSLNEMMVPDRPYISEQISPCIAHLMNTDWGKYSHYRQICLRIQELLCQ